MVRHAQRLVVLAVVLSPSWLCAQGRGAYGERPVNHRLQGPEHREHRSSVRRVAWTVLAVTREVGDWVKIAWPTDEDGHRLRPPVRRDAFGPSCARCFCARASNASCPAVHR